MTMSLKDMRTMLSTDTHPGRGIMEAPFRILTTKANAEVDQKMSDLLSTEIQEDKPNDD